MGYGTTQFQLPVVWKEFAHPNYMLANNDPYGPAQDVADERPMKNDIRSRTFRLRKYDFVITLLSDTNTMHYSLNFAVWKANSTGDTPLFARMGVDPDKLQREIGDAIYKYPEAEAPGLAELTWQFEVVWTPTGKHLDFIDQTMKDGDYILYAAAAGRSAILKYGRITKLMYSGRDRDGMADFAVQAVTLDDWGTRVEVQKKGAPVTLTFTNRMVVVYGVPTKFREPLDAAWYAVKAKERERK